MTKITIVHEGIKCSVSLKDCTSLDDILPLLEQALLGIGFAFKGQLTIYDEGNSADD